MKENLFVYDIVVSNLREERRPASDEDDENDVYNNYEVNEKLDEDTNLDVSLDEDCGEVDNDRHDHCDPDGDDSKMAKYYRQHQWASNPNGSIEIREGQILGNSKTTRDALSVTCSSLTIYRAKKIVLNNSKTDHITAYTKMKKYDNAIIAMNPGTCVKVSLTEVPGTNPRVNRFFLSFKASQVGVKKGYRPLIGIDGCHLTGQFGGVMLLANDLDGDNGIFPIAFYVYEFRTFESWTWFLKLLVECLGWDDRKPICLMSDQQKISGMPCKHIVVVFMYNRVFAHDHVHWYYTMEALKLTYNGAINHIPEESKWPKYHSQHIDLPAKRTKVDRPKKN
ncbi:hypothetical protein Ddye_018772 [Dipteronia dyeriana]|uniref:MULE transposase domain-containing protein n=1 Tax=Dipteronia dyeriana TaxID=168575 RepID=A0AAD9UBN7_9ROSI|nr:hypothetical protein Ddye_018772 [Dipteronia dyeriana]